ncbi:MAG: cell division protein FtsB [Planctomycetota bacterium]
MKIVIFGLLALLMVLQYRLWFGRGNLMEVQHFEEIKQEKMEENQQLSERNRSLAAEVVDLKQGMEAIEEKARSEMGMIENNETFYQIIDVPGEVSEDLTDR